MSPSRRCYVIHRRDGRLLALAPVQPLRHESGAEIGWLPVPERGQILSEVELTAEQVRMGPAALLEGFRIRSGKRKGEACLEPRAEKRKTARKR
jgi:hypothetical protein